MPRYLLHVRFKGTGYSGWQSQPRVNTVQDEVERALTTLLRKPTTCYGAGRTDSGVHAMLMPAHFDHEGDLHPNFYTAMNGLLPRDISITEVHRAVVDDFHARFSAIERAYRYQLIFKKDPLLYQLACWFKEGLDYEAMAEGAKIIMEYDSFESFCKARANNKTFICDIRESRFEWEGHILVYHVRANRFLRSMVRTMVGTLVDVGLGKLDADGLRRVIEGNDRRNAGQSMAADGLYLSDVKYREGILERVF